MAATCCPFQDTGSIYQTLRQDPTGPYVAGTLGSGSNYSAILGGNSNTISPGGGFNSILNGCCNYIAGNYAGVLSGRLNSAGGDYNDGSVIDGGTRNKIDAGADTSSIGGGTDNHIHFFQASHISSGSANYICAGLSGIVSGQQNYICYAGGSFVGGGIGNQIKLSVNNPNGVSVIAGGSTNKICSATSAIVGGQVNCIDDQSQTGVIGGGWCNCIIGAAGTGSAYSTIGGGQCNTICNSFSGSFSGYCGIVKGQYSAILGGYKNCVTHNYSSASGYGLTSVADCTFHTNCLNACGTPLSYLSAYPGGTIFAASAPPPPSCALPLYIKCP